jgi:site-specific recombinase XerD
MALRDFFKVEDIDLISLAMVKRVQYIDIQNYVIGMLDKGNSAQTVKGRISGLKSFYRYISYTYGVENLFANDFVRDLLKRNLDKDVVDTGVALSEEEVQKVIECAEGRDRVMLQVMFTTGCRRSELINIKWSDFHKDQFGWFLGINGKGRKYRDLKIKDEMIQVLNDFFVVRFGEMGKSDDILFEMDDSNVEKIVKKYSLRALGFEISPHDCRRTVITRLAEKGCPIEVIARYVGHSDINTTKRYIKGMIFKSQNAGDWI